MQSLETILRSEWLWKAQKACRASRCRTFRRLLHRILSFNSTCPEETGQGTGPGVHLTSLEQYFSGLPAEEGLFLLPLWYDGGPSNRALRLCPLQFKPVLHWYRPGEHHHLGTTMRSLFGNS